MDEQDYTEDGLSLRSFILPAILIAICNLMFFKSIWKFLTADSEQQEDRRFRYTAYFAINIFIYIFIVPLFLGRTFAPIFPSFAIACVIAYYISKVLFPTEGKEKRPASDHKNEAFVKFLKRIGLNEQKKLTLVDGWTIKGDVEGGSPSHDIINKFIAEISAQDCDSLRKLSVLYSHRNEGQENFKLASSRDILFALITCCDPVMLQDVIRKLSASGNAVPVLLPHYDDSNEVTLLLWGLRKTTLPKFDSKTKLMQEVSVITLPLFTISAIRFGQIPVSKSDVLNKIMATSYACEERESFLSYKNDPIETVWSKGTVECDWFVKDTDKNVTANVPYALFNLRGDGRDFRKQVKVCTKISNVVVVFANSVSDNDVQNLIETATISAYVILVICSETDISLEPTSGLSIVVAKDLDNGDIGQKILEIVKANYGDKRGIAIEEMIQVCEELDVNVDEQDSNHQKAKSQAMKTIGDVTLTQDFQKENLFPLHALWKEWIKIDTEEIGRDEIESQIADKLDRKNAVRSRQMNQELSEEFKTFLLAMNFENDDRKLYFAWVQILLDQINDTLLKPVQNELLFLFNKRKEIFDLMDGGESQSTADESEKQLQNVNSSEKECMTKYNGLKIGLDHYCGELGQIVECNYRLSDSYVDASLLPEKMANAVLNGISLQILHGEDCCSLLTKWLGDVFSTLDKVCQPHNKIRVVSILGGPSSYKSTLLNSLFGVNFDTGVGKCSQGIVAHLVPVHSSMKQTLGCDHLMIVDTESLITSEGKFSDSLVRSDYTVTLVSCISDVFIVSFGNKTSQREIQSILEVVSRGLLKAKEIKRSAKCCIVQHLNNEGDSEFDQDQETLSMFEKIEDVFQKIAKVRGFDQKYPEIGNTFCSEAGEKNIKFVRSRYVGFPPLLNKIYSKDMVSLRYYLLRLLANCDYPAMGYVEFCQRLVDVTSALKTTNFVANFQDTNLENLKDDFIRHYREWILTVEQELMERLTVACNEVKNSGYASMDEKLVEVRNNVTSITQGKFKDLTKRVVEEIQSTKYKSVQEQLPFFQKDLTKNEKEFLQVVEDHLEKSVQAAKKFQDRDIKLENETGKFIQELSQIEKGDRTNEELLQTLQETQNSYVEKLKRKHPCWDFDTIHDRTKSNISYMLNQCGDKVEELIKSKAFSEFAMKRDQGFTMSDVHVLKDKFCISDDKNEMVFELVRSDLESLCKEHSKFETNSTKAIKIFREAEEKFHSVVETITLYLFLSSKFVCGVHRSHVNEEVHLLAKIIQEDNGDATDSNSDIDHLWELVGSETYEMQDAEPLKFPNLERKLEYFLGQLEQCIPSENFRVLRKVLTVKNINNCFQLPFTFLTLQRLDRYFIAILPRMSSYDMKSIDDVVNEAKMTVISKAIAKASLDFGGTFNEIYRMIQLAILDHDQKAEIEAAALVHLSAWSLDPLSIKRHDDETENNVANSFRKLNNVFLAAYKTKLNEKCDVLVSEIVCDEIFQALVVSIEDEIVHRLRELFLTKDDLFNVKRVFIGTILRDLCIHDDYNGFVNFLQNFDEFSEKWILKFLSRECNKGNGSLLQKIFQELIDNKISATVSAVEQTSLQLQKEASQTLSNWLSYLQQNMLKYCNAIFQDKNLETLKNNVEVIDFEHFTDKLVNNLRTSAFKTSFVLPKAGSEDDTKIWLLSKGGRIHLELSQLIKGCTTQCPFCGAACEDTLGEHEFHKTALHYPGGVKGWRDTVTEELYVKICTSAIASNARYRTPEANFRPYKDYKEDYPKWDIPAKDDQPMEFWKYVFTKFNKNFAKHYNCAKGNVPKEWKSYTKEQAIKSVEVAYKLPPL